MAGRPGGWPTHFGDNTKALIAKVNPPDAKSTEKILKPSPPPFGPTTSDRHLPGADLINAAHFEMFTANRKVATEHFTAASLSTRSFSRCHASETISPSMTHSVAPLIKAARILMKNATLQAFRARRGQAMTAQ
jgi:hypothetical protein